MFDTNKEIPDYAYAIDLHQVANGKPSTLDSTSWAEEASDFGKFALSTVARAVSSTINIIPSVSNFFGADLPEVETENVLKIFDDNLAAYYSENRDTVDVVGDVVAMFVPGMAGVKGINLAQKGLSSIEKGTGVGRNIARGFGVLPSKGAEYAAKAAADISNTGNTFRVLDGNVIKAFASNYGQAAIEGAAFEVAASATMQNSPLFSEHSAKDILVNSALGGGLIGGAILGSVVTAQTYTGLSKAVDKVGKALNPYRFASGAEEGVDDFVKVLQLRAEKFNPPIPEEIGDPTLVKAAQRATEKRQRDLSVEIQATLTRMAGGDSEVASQLSNMLDVMDGDVAWKALLQLQDMTRVGSVSKLEAEHLGKIASGKKSDVVVKFLKIAGEGVGTVTNSQPAFIRLADTVSNKEELMRDVARRITSQPSMGAEFNPITQNHFDVEARYIKAFSTELQDGMNIGRTDLPFLEKAVDQKIGATVDGIYMDAATLRGHVKTTKLDLADKLEDAIATDPLMDSAIASKLLNVRQSVLEGKGYDAASDAHFFATTPADDLTKPSTIKVVYKGDPNVVGVSGNETTGMVQIKQLQEVQAKANNQAAAAVLGEDFDRLIKITDDKVLGATPRGAGAGLLTMASGEYGTLASIVEHLGKVTNEVKTKAHKLIGDTFQAPAYKLLQHPDAMGEVNVIRQAVLMTGEKYVLQEREGVRKLILKQQDDFERKVIAGKNPPEPNLPAGVKIEIPIKTDEAWEFLSTLVTHNDSYLQKEGVLRNAIGKGMGNWEGVVYFPQPSSKSYPYFSFVIPKNPFEQDKVQMIWARSAEELQKLESTVGNEFKLIRKDDTEKYYKMMQQYDADRGMNSRDFISEMRRTGTAAPFIPDTNTEELVQEIISHYKQASDKQIRDAVTLHNNVAFSELRRMDSEFKSIRSSKKPLAGEAVGVTPYESYVKTALDIPRSSSVPVWTELNNLAENVVSKVFNSLKGTYKELKSPEEMAQVNKHFDENGFRGVKDALTELVANHPAERRVLSEYVQAANGFFSTLILRTDPMNALNNGVGSMVLVGSETNYLTKLIRGKGGDEAAEFLRELGEVKLPGSEAYIKSPSKLIARAYESFISYKFGNTESAEKFARFEKNGWMPSMMDQLKSGAEALTVTGKETSGELRNKISTLMKGTGNLLEKATGNKFAEEMNRFVAAHIADEIAQAGIKYAGLGEKEANAFINTFVNRTQGNYTASQRPLMFQGAIGQSISLFMTYQFNMMQHMFRHIGNADKKSAAILLGLQSSIYGLNGLPAFNFMNEHLVGKASGNRSHSDVYSTGLDIPAVGDWLLYGGLSNATGLGLYSRGDMNPRSLTVVPSSVRDIPFISATIGVLGSLGKSASEIGAGANPVSTILRGIEHAGISRPLAGLAQTLNGIERGDDTLYSTTTKGNVVYAQDLYSLATLGRVLGARPFDEAVTRDAYHRVQVYEGQNRAQIESLGAAIRDKVNSKSEITDSDIEDFMESYVKSGKDQKNFISYYQRQVRNAGKNQINKLIERGNSSMGQYMQNLVRSLDSEPMDLE